MSWQQIRRARFINRNVTKNKEPGKLYWYDSGRRRRAAADSFPDMSIEQQLKDPP